MAQYEYTPLSLPADASRSHVREVMTLHAQFGGWELASHRIYPGGRRAVVLRRRLTDRPQPPLMT